jgi:hypothetical protein
MKNGELFEGDTLDRTWPEPKPLPRLWWWGEKPPSNTGGSERPDRFEMDH